MIDLPGHSRVWIYQANRFLTAEEKAMIQDEMNTFIQGWASHGNDLYGGVAVEYDLFLIIAADEQRAPASGCSIDTLMRKVQELGDKLNIDFFDRLKIAYEDASTQIHLVSMGEFKNLMSKDEVTGQTTVYNNLIENMSELESNWRTKVSNSWHKNLLQIL